MGRNSVTVLHAPRLRQCVRHAVRQPCIITHLDGHSQRAHLRSPPPPPRPTAQGLGTPWRRLPRCFGGCRGGARGRPSADTERSVTCDSVALVFSGKSRRREGPQRRRWTSKVARETRECAPSSCACAARGGHPSRGRRLSVDGPLGGPPRHQRHPPCEEREGCCCFWCGKATPPAERRRDKRAKRTRGTPRRRRGRLQSGRRARRRTASASEGKREPAGRTVIDD